VRAQECGRLGLLPLHRPVERRPAAIVDRIELCTGAEQESDDRYVPVRRGKVERRDPALVPCIHVRAAGEEERDHRRLVAADRAMEKRGASPLAIPDKVGIAVERRLYLRDVAALRGGHLRGIALELPDVGWGEEAALQRQHERDQERPG